MNRNFYNAGYRTGIAGKSKNFVPEEERTAGEIASWYKGWHDGRDRYKLGTELRGLQKDIGLSTRELLLSRLERELDKRKEAEHDNLAVSRLYRLERFKVADLMQQRDQLQGELKRLRTELGYKDETISSLEKHINSLRMETKRVYCRRSEGTYERINFVGARIVSHASYAELMHRHDAETAGIGVETIEEAEAVRIALESPQQENDLIEPYVSIRSEGQRRRRRR